MSDDEFYRGLVSVRFCEVFTAVTVPGSECRAYDALSLMFVAGEDARLRRALPSPQQPRHRVEHRRAKPPQQGNNPEGLGCTNRTEHAAPLAGPLLSVPFNKPGLHGAKRQQCR